MGGRRPPGYAIPAAAGIAHGLGTGRLADAAAFLLAWGVMMTAMMLPSAAPMIALYGAVHGEVSRRGRRGVAVALFALVYLAVWLALGVPVYVSGVALEAAAGAYPDVTRSLGAALALVLLAAGAYQFSPLKRSCLRVCRSPLTFLMGHWHDGYLGTLEMGLSHAGTCLGCCWALIVVLVAAGAMALPWVLLVASVVFAEKLLPGGVWTVRLVGAALIALGLLVAAQPGLAAVLHGRAM